MKVEEIVLAKYIADRVAFARGRVVTLHVGHISPSAEARSRIAFILTQLSKRNVGVVKVGPGKYALYVDSELGRRAKERNILGIISYIRIYATP